MAPPLELALGEGRELDLVLDEEDLPLPRLDRVG